MHNFITQNGKIVRETIGSGTTAKILDFIYDSNGRPFALKYTNGTATPVTYYYVVNLQGDVVGLTDETGAHLVKYSYNAWGEPIAVTDEENVVITDASHIANVNPLRYRGYYYDVETGFYYLQSRYYDPVLHRFINADSLASTGQGVLGYNMFAYCNNCSVILADETGHMAGVTSWELVMLYNEDELKEKYDSEYHNCYSYAFKLPCSAFPGDFLGMVRMTSLFSTPSLNKNQAYTVEQVGAFVMQDMEVLRKPVRIIKDPSDAANDEYVVALKVGKFSFSRQDWDMHFLVLEEDGIWSGKNGKGPITYGELNGFSAVWYEPSLKYYYDSNTIYFAVKLGG